MVGDEEKLLFRRIEHARVQPMQELAIVLLHPFGTRMFLELRAGALDLGQDIAAPVLGGARQAVLGGLLRLT